LELQQKREFPYGILKKARKLGFIGISFPDVFGGQDYGLFENVLVIEEFCRKDSGVGIALTSVDMGPELISRFGDPRQKERFLCPITKGETISSLVCPEMDEDGEGGASASLRMKDNGRYVLSGETPYVLNGSLADFFIVYCRMNSQEAGPGLQDRFAMVGKGSVGLSIIDMGDKLGMGMLPWSKLTFNAVEISKDDILGRDPNGFDQLSEIRKVVMVKAGAQALGIAQGAFDRALAYSKQREQFGKKIGEFQGIRHKLVDMHLKIEATRLLVYSAALQYDRRKVDLRDTMTANLFAEMAAVEVTDEALQIFGGAGYMIETPVEHFYRDARILRTLSGRQLPKKDVIAHSIIGRIT
jgi:alkylation response protein AidB-like acyl-CoA dehydrogenase